MGKFRLFGLQTDEISDREIKHRKLAREVASEGMVLLKNEGILPLQPQKIALYGAGARMTVKGGTGSGNMQERYSVTIEEGLINAGFEIVSGRWLERFDESFAKEKEEWRLGIEEKIKHYKPWEVQKMFDEVIHVMPLRFPIGDLIQETDISAETDTAIYVIARQAGESADRKLEKGDYYLSEVEEKNLSFLADKYKKILLVINCGGILDMSVLDKVQGIGAVLHFVQGGEEGGNAFADVVTGKVTPSGKLTDTWARDYEDYPCAKDFGALGDVLNQDYKEGVYVGYRWFDANEIVPRWPFGFGMSYTDFVIKAEDIKATGSKVTVTARRNELCGVLTLAQTVIIEKLTNILPLKKDFVEFIPKEKETLYPNEVKHLVIQEGAFTRKNISYDAVKMVFKSEQAKNHLKNLTDKELIELCVGAGFSGLGYNVTPTTVGRTSINLMKKGIPNVNFSDGPAGINLCPKNAYTKHGMPKYIDEIPKDWQWGWIRKMEPIVLAKPGKGYRVYQYMTCFPAVTLQAQTWNPDLIEKVGEAIGTEMVETGITLWLAPGMNIHRNPLCGRNFEYYSEDPLVSGIMASAVTRGVQSHKGLGVTIKHFCCNNQEDKRETVSENVKERALREIYLRGFEIAAKSSKPWAVMTSYNLVNGVHTFASADLCTKVLRNEWGYQGLVMTDWTASEKNPGEHAECILAGNDLIMPGHSGAKKELTAALKSNKISRRDLELAAANVLNVIFTSNVWEIEK